MRTASTMTCWLRFIVAVVAEELFYISTEVQVSVTWNCPRVKRKLDTNFLLMYTFLS